MLILISPAKTLDFTSPARTKYYSLPEFINQAEQLVNICKKFTPAELSSLMHISDKLAGLNIARFYEWQLPFNLNNAKQALFAFKGDVYNGLNSADFSPIEIDFAQKHLRILSGLYGILKPLDLIQPYRLEMGIKLNTPSGNDLYHFWRTQLTENINNTLLHQKDNTIIHLASQEYFKAILPQKLNGKIIKPIFLDKKNGNYKIISIYTKKARGLMCRYIIKKNLSKPEQLKEFSLDHYYFDEQRSSSTEYVFKRD